MRYEDQDVFSEVISGTDLMGQVPLTGVFPQTFKPASVTPNMVRREAQHTRERVLSGLKPQGSVDKEVATKTQREVEAKWAGTAVPLSELSQSASISRRFGLTQGSGENSKTRLIDDLSDSGINKAVQVCESPQPHTLDILACLLLECLETFPRSGFSGRSFDLKSAYRQLGLSESALTDSYVAFHDHTLDGPSIHQLLALPFGATRSVHSFLRVIHSVWALGCSIAFLWTVYFDDFPVVARDDDATGLADHIPRFFRLLGWQFAEDGPKAEGFGKTFSSLGGHGRFTQVHGRARSIFQHAKQESRASHSH